MRSAFLWRPYCKVTSILILLAEWASWSVSAQVRTVTLPEAPAMQTAEAALSAPAGSASISGQVTDLSGAAVPSAHVTLTNNGTAIQTATAGDRGQFRLEGLATGFYRVNVTAAGMGTYVSARFHLDAAEALKLTDIQLAVGATRADVEVTVTEQQVAEEQVKDEEKQRALGILPNFYSSYTWNAAPLPAKQKFSLSFHSLLDPFAFVGVGVAAGAEQAGNTYPGYGQGAAGYGKRYGAAYAD